jgi:hypothetical protein
MTPKDKILDFAKRMPDNVTLAELLYKLELFCGVEKSLDQIRRGKYIEHDELFDRLLKEDEENKNNLVSRNGKKSPVHKSLHRQRRSKKSRELHQTTKKVG